MIPDSGYRFSEKIMLEHGATASILDVPRVDAVAEIAAERLHAPYRFRTSA
jgi:hypothetical protein